ncbi:hypothetical protein Bca4012_083923 [Brassica carinata]
MQQEWRFCSVSFGCVWWYSVGVSLSLFGGFCRYQMPLALVGLLESLALWELFKYCSDRWKFDHHPSAGKLVIGIGQCE